MATQTPVFLPGKFHEQISLAGYSPWSCKELDTTEQLTHTDTHTHTHGMRIRQALPQPYIPLAGMQVPQKAQEIGAGAQGLWSNPRARAAVDCGETDQGDSKEEIVVGNACGGKSGSHGSKAVLLSHAQGVEPSPQPLSPLPSGQLPELNSREAGPSNA